MIKRLTEDTGNRSFDRIDRLCKRFGYALDEESCIKVINGNKYLDVYVYADGSNKYAPHIYPPARAAEQKILNCPNFRVQTSSYGALLSDEYEQFAIAVENANKLVQSLSNYDFSGFPEVEVVNEYD